MILPTKPSLIVIMSSLIIGGVLQPSFGLSPSSSSSIPSRRSFLTNMAVAGVATLTTSIIPVAPSSALDIDAFVQKELSSSAPPKLTEDEALCRFGQPSKQTGEACVKAGMSTKRKTGVDAFGQVDRGDYTRCKVNYVEDKKTGKLVNEWNCQ